MSDQANYDLLETPALTSILIDAGRPENAHMSAIEALAERSEAHRTPAMISALEAIIRNRQYYSENFMIRVAEVLAMDSSLKATVGLLDAFPAIVGSIYESPPMPEAFRRRYYELLIERQSDDDLGEWGKRLENFDARTIAGAAVDKAGEPLSALEPWELLGRLSEPERTSALFFVIFGSIMGQGDLEAVKRSIDALRESHDKEQLAQGVEKLIQYWEKAQAENQAQLSKNIETILKILDRRPRTAMEKISGKRPWAP